MAFVSRPRTAGTEGAWITGVVLADENPIYEDVNANAIDDRFEIVQRGALLPANASKPERQLSHPSHGRIRSG
jgi:hypothetical protein